MSRIAKKPVGIPEGVEVKTEGRTLYAKGPKGEGRLAVHKTVDFSRDGDSIEFRPHTAADMPLAGTMRSLADNLMTGVSRGFERKLELVGVGYRAQLSGGSLNLQLGYSHPVNYRVAEGIKIKTPNQNEIVISGADKQKVGQVAAEIRAFRPPEPYKGKGVRYADETVVRKETKKK